MIGAIAKLKIKGATTIGNINKEYIKIFIFVVFSPAITGNIGIFAFL